jgi:hypothetical protein
MDRWGVEDPDDSRYDFPKVVSREQYHFLKTSI